MYETYKSINKGKPCKSSEIASWRTGLGELGGGGALRLVLLSEDSAEDPRLTPATFRTRFISN